MGSERIRAYASEACGKSGGVYPNEFPAEGVDFRKYEGGVEGLKGIWKNWMYEDGGKGDLKKDVHPMVNETVVHAFKILGACDESKDGHITKAEWEKCQKFKSAEDALYDFEYVYALDQVSGKMLKLLKEKTLNPADPDTYPELKEANSTISAKEVRISALETTLGKTREELAHSQKVGIGFGSLAVLSLIFGVAVARTVRATARPC